MSDECTGAATLTEPQKMLVCALNLLTDREQSAIILKYIGGKTLKEIAIADSDVIANRGCPHPGLRVKPMSHSRMQQIIKKGLAKIRAAQSNSLTHSHL